MKSETNVIRKIRENRNPGTELDFNIKGYDEAIIRQNSETWDDIGVPSLVVDPSRDLVCGYHLAILRPKHEVVGSFLNLALQERAARTQFSVQARGVTRYGLTHNGILSVQVPLPPPEEQERIVRHLTKEQAEIQGSITQARRQINLMNEYRTRLIADVVTGQLDVRETAAQLQEAPWAAPSRTELRNE